MGSPDCKDIKIAMWEVNFRGTWFTPSFGGFGGVEKDWNGKTPYEWVKYEWNGPPQLQMFGFRNLIGTGIAPVSKKTAVKRISDSLFFSYVVYLPSFFFNWYVYHNEAKSWMKF